MGISEREHHIKVLEDLLSHYKAREKCEGYYDRALKDNVEALQYAISSIKTDLKYNLMYEGEDIYTKADVVAMLEEISLEMDELNLNDNWETIVKNCCKGVVQARINALKEQEDGND